MTFKEQKQFTKNYSDDLLSELINYQGENVIGEIVRLGIQNLMELERDEHIGVGNYERGEDRRSQRNGFKSRTLYTRVGSLVLQVPQTRDGLFYPSILERYQRSEKALVLALAEAYLQGVSTRKMKMITEQLMGKEFSSTTISRFSATLDAELDAWRERYFTKEYPYVVVDARYENCRVDGKIIDIACLVALGIDSEGHRHVLGMDTAWSETSDSWDRFIGGLKKRGLRGVRLVTSDDHPGIHPAIKKYYPGAVWQRCQRHFTVNVMDHAPKSRRDDLHGRLKRAWDCKEYEDARAVLDKIAEDYHAKYPDLADFISEHSWETLGVYHAAPPEHHKRLRTSNMIERVNQELKRRSKVVRIFPNPKSCQRLFTALLKEWHEDWAYGKIYLRMDLLEEFEAEKAHQQEHAPADVPSPFQEENINRGLLILQK
jgi:putative transposase